MYLSLYVQPHLFTNSSACSHKITSSYTLVVNDVVILKNYNGPHSFLLCVQICLTSSVNHPPHSQLISISLWTVWGYRLKRYRLFGHVCSDCLIRSVCGCCCCSFLSAWSQVFNTSAKSTPPMNQIKLTCPLSLKLCNPGFELNQVT